MPNDYELLKLIREDNLARERDLYYKFRAAYFPLHKKAILVEMEKSHNEILKCDMLLNQMTDIGTLYDHAKAEYDALVELSKEKKKQNKIEARLSRELVEVNAPPPISSYNEYDDSECDQSEYNKKSRAYTRKRKEIIDKHVSHFRLEKR
jgi:hypothetical protein